MPHAPMRALWVVCASAGCRFDLPEVTSIPDASGDAPVTPSSVCDAADPSLRLCVDFQLPIADRSGTRAALDAANVAPLDRDGEPAAALTIASTIHVRESPAHDIQGGLTLDMWIRPAGLPAAGTRFWMLDNHQQYAAYLADTGAIHCIVGTRSLDSAPLPIDGRFHHAACTHDGTKLKVFIDGDLSRCVDAAIAIPIAGTAGLAIGANLSGTDLDPLFAEQFGGGLDDVRLWARSNVDLCAAANRTSCNTACP